MKSSALSFFRLGGERACRALCSRISVFFSFLFVFIFKHCTRTLYPSPTTRVSLLVTCVPSSRDSLLSPFFTVSVFSSMVLGYKKFLRWTSPHLPYILPLLTLRLVYRSNNPKAIRAKLLCTVFLFFYGHLFYSTRFYSLIKSFLPETGAAR